MIFAYPYPEQTGVNKTFIFHAAKDWNSHPNDLKECNFLSIFKSKLKTFLKRSHLILNLDSFLINFTILNSFFKFVNIFYFFRND